MKILLILTCFTISINAFAQKKIPVTSAHELALAMNEGSLVGTSDVGATVRISEHQDYLIIKNYTSNSELKITELVKEEKTTEKAAGIIYSGKFNTHPARITMVVLEGSKIRARIRIGEQKMVVNGIMKSNTSN